MEKILSVIVPVYNVERFLPRCLDSLLRQGMQSGEWEIICVDDGSTDGCPAILADYAQRYPDLISVITHQQNQGLGPARNTGMAVAQGEYIGFVDSDDYMIDGAYAHLCQHFLEGKPDVIHFDHSYIETDGKTLPTFAFEVGQQSRWVHTDGKTLVDPQAKPEGKVIYQGDGTDAYNRLPLRYAWTKLYKNSFIRGNHLKNRNVICQDGLFNFEVFSHHPSLLIVSSNLCRHEQNNANSIQNTTDWEIVRKQLNNLLFVNVPLMEEYLERNGDLEPAAKRNINVYLGIFYKKALRVRLPRKEWLQYSKKLKQLPKYKYPHSNGLAARLLDLVNNLSGRSRLFYIVVFDARRLYLEK